MADADEPLLDVRDIQGNIIPGFSRAQQYLASFAANDEGALRRALRSLPQLTTMETALTHRDERKSALRYGMARPMRGDLWINLALSADATDLLGASKVRSLDPAFARGMRPSLTGDPTSPTLPDGSPNSAHRDHWKVGSRNLPCDLLLTFAHDTDAEALAAPIIARFSDLIGSKPSYAELGALLPGEIEHFGFRDGISQPGVFGRVVVNGTQRLVTTRYGLPPQRGVEFGKPGQPLAWPGQFLTGQPAYVGDVPALEPEFSNGSFVVFRRLQQDVSAFLSDTASIAAQLGSASGVAVSADQVRALIVGRLPSGASLMRAAGHRDGVEGPLAINHFGFGHSLPALTLSNGETVEGSLADPDFLRGRLCPIWAHTRKVNPRELGTDRGGEHETLGFQMLRRGIPFGPLYNRDDTASPENEQPRGLLFVSYQRSIEDQFGVLNRGWMNNRDAPSGGGFDLLVGQHVAEESGQYSAKDASYFPLGRPDGSSIGIQLQRQWVIPTGGAFLFAPSLRFLEKFVGTA